MPRHRPRTRLHVLADALTALDAAAANLQEIDLRSTHLELRAEVKEAREAASAAMLKTQKAYMAAASVRSMDASTPK